MKPCAAHRESLALLAGAALNDAESGPVQAHLRTCPDCRAYFADLTAICAAQSEAAEALPSAEVRPELYRRIAAGIRPSPTEPKASWLTAFRMGPLSFAGVAALLLGWLGVWALYRPAPANLPGNVRVGVISVPAARPLNPVTEAAGSPKFLAYRLALNRSPEAFEQMLTAEETRPSPGPGVPVLRNLARSEAGL